MADDRLKADPVEMLKSGTPKLRLFPYQEAAIRWILDGHAPTAEPTERRPGIDLSAVVKPLLSDVPTAGD